MNQLNFKDPPDVVNSPNDRCELQEPLVEQIADRKHSIHFGDDYEEDTENHEPLTMQVIVQRVLMGIGFLTLCWIFFWYLAEPITRSINHSLGWLVRDPGIFRGTALILLGIPFTWFFVPGLTTVNVLQAFLMKSFWLSLIISFLRVWLTSPQISKIYKHQVYIINRKTKILTSIGLFYLVKKHFRLQIVDRFKKKLLFQVLYLEIKEKPYEIGVMFSFLFVPVAIKNYLMYWT